MFLKVRGVVLGDVRVCQQALTDPLFSLTLDLPHCALSITFHRLYFLAVLSLRNVRFTNLLGLKAAKVMSCIPVAAVLAVLPLAPILTPSPLILP